MFFYYKIEALAKLQFCKSFLKNTAVLQGVSPKNCLAACKTNRVLQAAYYSLFNNFDS